jgi:acyl-homoserine-lactone acylase
MAGPVVEKDGKLLAIRAVGLQGAPYAGELDEWLQMGRAKNLAEFQAALQRQQIPMFTIIYADRDAHIMIVFNGEAPVHTKGTASFWKDPVPAETSDLLWNSIYPYKDLPKAIDPASGWVQNSNCAPWYMTEPFLNPKDYPADIAPGFDERLGRLFTREQRAIRMLTQDQKISFDKLVADKYSTRSETADRHLDDLIAAVQQYGPEHAKQAAEVLRKWDRTADVDSRGGALFQFWIDEMLKYHDFTAVPFDLKRPIDTPRGFKDPKAAAEALAVAADKLEKLAGRLDVPWGDLYRFRRGQFDFPGNGSGNTFGTFRVVDYAPTKDGHFQGYDGDSFIAAVEFGDTVHAKVLMTYGNASDPASPHFGDQLALASKKELRDAWLTREAVEKNLEGRTDFKSDGKIVETQP